MPSVDKFSHVMKQASKQGLLLIPPFGFCDVVSDAADSGAVGPEAGKFIVCGFSLIGGLLFDQCLANLL